uniref:CCHC-type domain-containing protein n=1 Tax=Meloidogyne incognita TaxID=6306 RepID=A0A914L0L7_MELIC
MEAKVLEKLLKAQQEQFEKMLVRLLKPSEMNDTELYSKLVGMIGEFVFDLTSGMTFESWLGRHRSYFEEEGKTLPESSKVRLLLSKLGPEEYAQIERKMLPTKLSEMKFDELCSELVKEFSDHRSKLLKRFEALNVKCSALQDIVEFGNVVNAQCERAEMALSIEELKILIFISGLPSDATSVRQVAMKSVESKSERGQAVTLKEIIEECRAYMANKSEALYLIKEKISEVKKEVPVVNTVEKVKCWKDSESENGSECKKQWTKPNVKYQQNIIQKKCSHCGRFGHWRMHCSPYCAILDICDPMQSVEKEEWIKQKVKFGELDIEMIVDTASQINVVNKEVWKSIGQPKIEKVNYSGIGLGDNKVEIEGKFKSKVRMKDKDVFMDFHVVNSEVCILGLPGLKEVSVQNQKPKYKKWSEKKANFKIQKNAFPNGTKVKVKNTNKRSGKIEWLKGEILRKTENAWKVKVSVLKSIVTRSFKEIRRDEWSNKKKLLNEDIEGMNISEETIVSESSVTSSVNSVYKSKKIKAKTQDTYNGNKPKMKDVEEDKQMEM